ncbi:MAG: DUF3313 domain-containing protein [Rhodospirillales bacterium]
MILKFGRVALVLSGVVLATACAPTKQITDVQPTGGFLPQPALLQSGKEGFAALSYFNSNADWPSYTKVILEPVTLWGGANSKLDSVPPEKRKAFANALYGELYNAASQRCQMVTEPSPGTLRVRFALVEAEASNPTLNTISTYVPQARILSTMAGYAFNSGAGVFTGSATVEGYAADAETGQLLWQAVDKRAGANAIGSNTFNSWGDVDNAFKAWAKQFGERMTKLGVCP